MSEPDSILNKSLQSAKDNLAGKMVEMAQRVSGQKPRETVYNVVFTGTYTSEEKMAVAAMAKLFRMGQEAAKRMLQTERVIKSYDNKVSADKMVKMLANIGLICKVKSEVIGESEDDSLLAKAALMLDEATVPQINLPTPASFTRRHWMVSASVAVGVSAAIFWIVFMPPVVNGNSFATYEASVQKVIDQSPTEKKAPLRKAVDYLTGAEFEFHKRNTAGGNEEVAANMAYGSIKGMNADQIVAAAEVGLEDKRRGYREAIANMHKQIADEQAEVDQLAANNTELNKLELSDAQFSWGRGDAPQMDMKLENNSTETLDRVYLQCYLYDIDGRLVATAPGSYGISMGGIPPRGVHYLTLIAHADDVWSTPLIHANYPSMIFKATVENAEDVNGKMIGVDLRPYRKKIEDDDAQAKKLERELGEIRL